MSDENINITVGLQAGAPLCIPHSGSRGSQVKASGVHDLRYQRNKGRGENNSQPSAIGQPFALEWPFEIKMI